MLRIQHPRPAHALTFCVWNRKRKEGRKEKFLKNFALGRLESINKGFTPAPCQRTHARTHARAIRNAPHTQHMHSRHGARANTPHIRAYHARIPTRRIPFLSLLSLSSLSSLLPAFSLFLSTILFLERNTISLYSIKINRMADQNQEQHFPSLSKLHKKRRGTHFYFFYAFCFPLCLFLFITPFYSLFLRILI